MLIDHPSGIKFDSRRTRADHSSPQKSGSTSGQHHAVADVADAVEEEEEGGRDDDDSGGGGADAAAGHLVAGGAVAAPGADAHLLAPPILLMCIGIDPSIDR